VQSQEEKKKKKGGKGGGFFSQLIFLKEKREKGRDYCHFFLQAGRKGGRYWYRCRGGREGIYLRRSKKDRGAREERGKKDYKHVG